MNQPDRNRRIFRSCPLCGARTSRTSGERRAEDIIILILILAVFGIGFLMGWLAHDPWF